MRIESMTVTPVAMPDPPLRNSVGVHQPVALRIVVELTDEAGRVGLGEAPGGSRRLAALEAAVRDVVGQDPHHLGALRERVPDPRVFSAIEVACLDLAAQAAGVPVVDLLGGPVRDRVPFSAYLFFKNAAHQGAEPDRWGEVLTPEAMVEEARTFVDRYGFRALKVKGGVLDPHQEARTMALLREAFPDRPLRLDPNALWSVETSLQVARAVEPLELEWLEDPARGMDEMAQVRASTRVPLSTNMCVTAFEDLPQAVALRPVDVILADHHFWGGLRETVRLSAFCRDFGFGVGMHSNSHYGISLAAMVHVGAAMPHLTADCDTHYPWLEEDIVQGEPFHFEDGALRVPAAPGLGVTLDRDRLKAAAERYRRMGITDRDDRAGMPGAPPDAPDPYADLSRPRP
ncbi:MAG: glucarate dehydratase [Candidatus Dormibacteraeota bacterium]|nr:glucarate dehydratase [Candidatus Dormibacteraeota bacterium]